MKILVIQDFLRSGGTERQSVLLANAFARRGHPTALLTFRPGGALASTVSADVARLVLQPVDLHLDWFAPGLTSGIRRFSPDVMLCMGRMANCYGATLQRKFPQAAVIATMRTGKPLPARFVHSLRTTRHVVANSREARDHLVTRCGLTPGRVSVIYNSLVFPSDQSTAAESSRDTIRRRYGAGPGTTVLLSVAMFRPEKNQRELIETLRTLPPGDWQLWLAGEGPARAACEAAAAKSPIAPRVKFLGFQRDPSGLYAAADVAVHASRSEALSNFLIEAQAHGVPAVAYQAQGIEECFLPGETGWAIPVGDRHQFCAAVMRIIESPAHVRLRRAAAARAFARETFDPQRQVAAYLELFQTCLARPTS